MNHHHIRTGLALAAALMAVMPCAQAQSTPMTSGTGMNSMPAGKIGASDRKFINDAAIGGMAEVAAGKMAQEKGSSDAVKQFGARMVQDHGKANDELMQLASTKGVTPPASLDKPHQMMADRLGKLSGPAFDSDYMKGMVADHKKTVALFQGEASSGRDADLKAWAAKTLPTLQEHLQMAQTQYDAVKGGSSKTAAR